MCVYPLLILRAPWELEGSITPYVSMSLNIKSTCFRFAQSTPRGGCVISPKSPVWIQ